MDLGAISDKRVKTEGLTEVSPNRILAFGSPAREISLPRPRGKSLYVAFKVAGFSQFRPTRIRNFPYYIYWHSAGVG